MFQKMSRVIALLLVVLLLVPGPSYAQGPAELKLPADAIKISDAIPAMGEHWANPRNLPLGPIYLVWQNKVIGVEYMFTLAMMERMAVPTPAGEEVFYEIENLPLFGQKIDHLTVDYMADGHAGFEVPHYDVHLYFISPADRYKVVLNVPPPPAVSPAPASAKPAGAIQASPVVPAMGSHWAMPKDLPFGPLYLVDKGGKEVGVEFMYNHDKMRSTKVPEGNKMIWASSIDYVPVGRTLNHMTVEYMLNGHEGYTVWHFDLHLYAIAPEERGRILP